MPYKEISKTRLTAYTPAYIKLALREYVRRHPGISISKFVKDAVHDKLVEVGELPRVVCRVRRRRK